MSATLRGRGDGAALRARTAALTALAMLAFAGNSLLCRVALTHTGIDAASFTTVRLAAGGAVLWLLVRKKEQATQGGRGNWASASALFAYACGFSFAYATLTAATGALLLFGAIQVTMIGWGLWTGERPTRAQLAGIVLALAGIVGLMLPGISAPQPLGAILMLAAGVAWGVYSLRGKGAGNPMRVTAGNFLRAAPIAAALSVVLLRHTAVDLPGLACAIASGAVTSGIGYSIWYAALPALRMTTAATVQLSVPVIVAAGGVLALGEPVSLRLFLAALAILGGIALVIARKRG